MCDLIPQRALIHPDNAKVAVCYALKPIYPLPKFSPKNRDRLQQPCAGAHPRDNAARCGPNKKSHLPGERGGGIMTAFYRLNPDQIQQIADAYLIFMIVPRRGTSAG
ncbi:hypothetical protein EVAR_37791_1 [Eumeta japonica]|uniref:Uncharacterized protein n=1 Tax=Eumeta variegata TaxID=151549 RepID=A0A4C1W9R1_EUMVA|nr:hypothetical protein EVAR_37791_1 [Eumeta japonica]